MEGDLVKSKPRSVESATGEYVGIVNKSQEQVDLCVDFMLFWLSPAGYQPYLDASADDPTFSPGGPLQIVGVEDTPKVKELFANIPNSGNAEAAYNGVWTSGGDSEFSIGCRDLFKNALEGSIAPEDYATQLQAYFQDNFDAYLELAQMTQADIDDPSRQPGT
jgi:hypothetical protein